MGELLCCDYRNSRYGVGGAVEQGGGNMAHGEL